MEEVVKIIFSVCLVFISSLFFHLYNVIWLKPQRLRSKLRKQGINGPPPSFPYGNIPDIKKFQSMVEKNRKKQESIITHDFSYILYPHLMQWREQYGKVFTFSLGNVQVVCLTHPDLVKEMILSISLDLGKPSYQQKEFGALLGKGIVTSNGLTWLHHRKVVAPQFYLEKVKGGSLTIWHVRCRGSYNCPTNPGVIRIDLTRYGLSELSIKWLIRQIRLADLY